MLNLKEIIASVSNKPFEFKPASLIAHILLCLGFVFVVLAGIGLAFWAIVWTLSGGMFTLALFGVGMLLGGFILLKLCRGR